MSEQPTSSGSASGSDSKNMKPLQPYKNLVFEGGGTKGSAYAGAMQVLEEHGLFAHIEQVGGTSAGSITAALLATGGGSARLTESVETTQFAKFVADKGGWFADIKRTISDYGIHTGDEFVDILQQNIKQFSGNPELTFHQLKLIAKEEPAQFKQLTVIASNLTKQRSQIFNCTTSPDLPIWKAVRASISIPIIFEPMHIDGELYVDGGLAWNYPIDIFDEKSIDPTTQLQTRIPNPATVGFYLEPQAIADKGQSSFRNDDYTIDSLKTFALGLSAFLYTTANAKHLQTDDRTRTVFIDDLGVNGVDFSLPKEQIEALIESGRKATQNFLDGIGN